ncbi:hypothetical protein PA598K_05304 [Paenibacillus sp. 598K]|nr:hypothetical protein PA598K_05304 [Paenibacillus sp. 598K]
MRKKAFLWMMSLMLVFSMLPLTAAAAAADQATGETTSNTTSNPVSKTIYVATTGDDNTGDGTQAKPYKTIGKAKEVVRTLPKTDGDIVVQIADGFYSLDETLVFSKEDSGSASSTIRYEAAPGAKPVVSAGEMLDKGVWTEAVGLTQTGGLKAYKTTLKRDDKLRAIYVNDKIASMTLSAPVASANRTVNGTPTVSFSSADNDWAWRDGSNIRAGIVFDASVGLKADTKNPQNIEAESVGGSTARWARPFVTFASIEKAPEASGKPGGVMLRFQMPYGAISQSLSNNTQYNPGNNQVIRNAFEFFNKRGDFYFDQAESTLYYIPLEGEDINKADVVIPKLETVLDIRGIPVGDRLNPVAGSDDGRVHHVTFKGLKFAHTDYKLFELTGTYTLSDGTGKVTSSSRGYASVQGSIVNTVYFPSSINWHETFYRGYDIPPAAIMINAARHIKVLDGEIMLTGFNGIHIENDVKDIEVTGNYIADTLASGVVIGHPHHIYENDKPDVHESRVSVSGTPIKNWAGVDKEKFKSGTEAVPENIYITNNFLFRNCYGFPGANSLASFYTTNMQVLHNYFYDSTYGAMSIGWGWDEYDGFGFTAQGTNKTGGPYHGTHETSLARSPEITTTSRNNKISYNRVEEICTVVNDSGAIYSLGRQGDPGTLPNGGTWDSISTLTNNPVTDKSSNWHPDNWTNYTEMNYNFLDPNPTGKPTTSNNWTNGFHPDEGSTFIKMIGNVVQSKLSHAPGQSRLFEFNNWKRKSDMIATNGYVDGNNNQNGAPRITYDNYKSEARIWPVEGNAIVLNSGLKNEYTHMIPRSLIADTEFELASNVIVSVGGEKVSRRGLLKAEDTVWLAPANTTTFKEGPTMTKAAGNATSISTPAAAGQYKLYIVYADGRATATSKYTAYVDASEPPTNVEDGKSYEVSKAQPLKLTLNAEYTFTLNGTTVADAYEISTAGNWTLVVRAATSETTIKFTTTVSEANKLLQADVTVAPGGTVRFAYDLDDATKKVWISSSSGGHFDGGDDETVASGDALGMKAPMLPGPYVIYVLAEDGQVLGQSHARVVVSETAPVDPTVDKALLSALIEDANTKQAELYTRSTWNAFARALNEAKTAASNPAIGQDAADSAYYALRNATKGLRLLDTKQLVEVFREDFNAYAAGTGTLDTAKWQGQNNQVSVTEDKALRFAPTGGSNVRAQTVETFGDMELTFDFNVNSGTNDQGFYIYFRTTDRNVPANLSNRNGFELAIGPGFNPNLRILEHVNNNLVSQLSGGSTAIQREGWYTAKIVMDGSQLQAKIWPRGSEEPTQATMSGAISNNAIERGKGHLSFEFYGNTRSGLVDNVIVKEMRTVDLEENAELDGPSTVVTGHPVQLSVGIDNLVSGIDALSVEVNYDPAKIEYQTVTDDSGIVSLAEGAITEVSPGLNILATAVKPSTGKILVIASTKGGLYQESGELFVLNGHASSSAAAGATSVSLSDFVVTAQANARNINTQYAVLDMQVRLTDGAALAAVIEQAQELLRTSTEGSLPGQYPVGSKAKLQAAIQVATNVLANPSATENDIAQAITALGQAIATFRSSVIADPSIDKSELIKAIEAAKAKLDSVVEGNKVGQYASSAVQTLRAAVQQAEAVRNDGSASQSTVNQAVTTLKEAVTAFASGIITLVPGQSAVTILDLSYLAKYYGTKSTDPNWSKVEKADLFGSGEITIRELSAVARMIVENWLSE